MRLEETEIGIEMPDRTVSAIQNTMRPDSGTYDVAAPLRSARDETLFPAIEVGSVCESIGTGMLGLARYEPP